MVSANPTGPITVASARNGAYGDSVARLLEYAGHDVAREYYYNDAGAQMDKFRESVEAGAAVRSRRRAATSGTTSPSWPTGGDPVAPMLERIETTLERFRIHFDSWPLQSELEQRITELLPRLPTYEREGAVWVRSSEFGDDSDQVIIRSAEKGGLPTYRAADIAYLQDKLDRGFDRAIYVLGADHHGTRNWYGAVARMLDYDPERVEVLIYQLVHLIERGVQKKLSKRRGDVVFLDDFIDAVGVDARWYLVSRGPDQTIDIDVDLAAEKSQKNPVYYVQYAHARIAGIRRNAEDAEVSAEPPRARRRRARPDQAPGRVPGCRRRGDRAPQPTPSRRTRSAWRTISTASTTSTASSRARPRPSAGPGHGDAGGDRPLARPGGGRSARPDVACAGTSRSRLCPRPSASSRSSSRASTSTRRCSCSIGACSRSLRSRWSCS